MEQLARLKDRVATALILLLRSQCTDEETGRREPEDQRNLVRFPQIVPHAVVICFVPIQFLGCSSVSLEANLIVQ